MSCDVRAMALHARKAAFQLAAAPTKTKNDALAAMAEGLRRDGDAILTANAIDVAAAKERGTSEAMIDRLTLDLNRLEAMAEGLRQIAALPDPVGETVDGWTRPNGLVITRVRVPMGVVGIIYEARPNVTADAAGLCLKSGNACILRGGSEALGTNAAIAKSLRSSIATARLPENAIQFVESSDREDARKLMRLNGLVDVLIPRGGESLIRSVVENATVPVLETGTGNCHTFVDASADLDMAVEIAVDAKCSRPSVCNAMETLLVHDVIAEEFLPLVAATLMEKGVELRGCKRTREIIKEITPAVEEDWSTEYLALILAVKVVDCLDQAIEHINTYGTRHSECIVTEDLSSARRFCREVDAACVYVNASTRFTDGNEFGFGAEVGISNQKLHARGPMGLRELTTTKYIINGEGQTRK